MRNIENLIEYVNNGINEVTSQQLNKIFTAKDFVEILLNIENGLNKIKNEPKVIDRDDFMEFFRGEEPDGSDDLLNQLSVDDRIEIFSQIMLGSSDFTKELLDTVLSDYDVDNLEVVEIDNSYRGY
jgi:hypothetical protein